MSGTKQHHIPNAFIGRFGVLKNPKKRREFLVCDNRENFQKMTLSTSILFENEFYSPDEEGELDQIITDDYEPLINNAIQRLDASIAATNSVDSADVALVVSHLLCRTEHMRSTLEDFSKRVTARIHETGKATAMAELILDAMESQPPPGITQEFPQLWSFALAMMRPKLLDMLNVSTTQLTDDLNKASPDMAANAHKKALKQSIAPNVRVDLLENMKWDVVSHDTVMPDCIALARLGNNPVHSAIFMDRIDSVFFPFSPNIILVGYSGGTCPPIPEYWDYECARNSTRLFVSKKREDHLVQHVIYIGAGISDKLDEICSTHMRLAAFEPEIEDAIFTQLEAELPFWNRQNYVRK